MQLRAEFVIFCAFCKFVCGQGDLKSSLTFVIDDTGSMSDDIAAVKRATHDIFDVVYNSKATPVKEFVLVTFNDATIVTQAIKQRTITDNDDTFLAELEKISVDGGGDCPESSMAGIELGISNSLPYSYVYVFTDASSTDSELAPRVVSSAQTKHCQIVFVLTGFCDSKKSKDYLVYADAAKATNGIVFDLEHKIDIDQVLNYTKVMLKERQTELARHHLPSGRHNITVPVDVETKTFVVSGSGVDKVSVTAPDGKKAETKDVINLSNTKAVEVTSKTKGDYGVDVDCKTDAILVVTAPTKLTFLHGFSMDEPADFNYTISCPIDGENPYYLIIQPSKSATDEYDVVSTLIMNMDDVIMGEEPLTPVGDNYFVTEAFETSFNMFQIAVKYKHRKSKSYVIRKGATPIEPQKLLTDSVDKKSPKVNILGESILNVNYGTSIELNCNVVAYPRPKIIWRDSERDLSKRVVTIGLPYDYASKLNINVTKNMDYSCSAANELGVGYQTVTIKINPYITVIEKPKFTEIEYKGNGTVTCKVKAYPPVTIGWFLNNELISSDEHYELSEDSSILTIKNAGANQNGKLECAAKNENNQTSFFTGVYVSGMDKPKINKLFGSYTFKVGDNISIPCSIMEGSGDIDFKWQQKAVGGKDYVVLPKNDSTYTETAIKGSAGTYMCQATNEFGGDRHVFNVNVEYPPEIILLDPKNVVTNQYVEIDTVLNLSCQVDSVPFPTVTWIKNGEIAKIHDNAISGMKIYYYSSYQRITEKDNATYVCRAENKYGSENVTINIIVGKKPTIAPQYNTNISKALGSKDLLVLPCDADGMPRPKITWYFYMKNGTEYKRTLERRSSSLKGELILFPWQSTHDGRYECVAQNKFGDSILTYTLTVTEPAYINKDHDTRLYAVNGDLALRIPCEARGNPKPTIEWVLGEGKLSTIEPDGTLTFGDVRLRDRGTYMCKATNEFNTDTLNYTVIVTRSPRVPTRDKTLPVRFAVGSTEILKCGIPNSKVDLLRWYKDGEIISTNEELIFEKVKHSDYGTYTCRVSTLYDAKDMHFNIIPSD